jgi:hypothetical protein
LRKLLKYYFINRSLLPLLFLPGTRGNACRIGLFSVTFLLLINCAPQIITTAPPQYREELSLDEIIAKVSDEIQVLKAVADIRIEKNNELIDQINASALVQRPDRVHMRVYKLGMLARDIVMQDSKLYGLSGKNSAKIAGLIDEFFHAVFWWDDVEDGSLYSLGAEYIIRTVNKEIHLDKATLLALRQDIRSSGKTVHITYADPQNYEGFWYPSKLVIDVDEFRFSVKIAKLIKNPPLGESDFKLPSGG